MPTHANPTLIFKTPNSVGNADGNTTIVKICLLVAPIERISKIFPASVSIIPPSDVRMVTTMQISTVIIIIALAPAPTQIIITGPNAILGKLLSTTTYGSVTFRKKSDHHNAAAMAMPETVDTANPITHSLNVVKICFHSPCSLKLNSIAPIREGEDVIKLSIAPIRAAPSHKPKNATSNKI
ncbi:MAG: hypothetical protein BHW39_05945 [Firmicutes bacterium CAG:552_39_19]|nr:MAG: hypothetical protein BHW39_05945 [Firmicutes bacterium CAG:552_39_19]